MLIKFIDLNSGIEQQKEISAMIRFFFLPLMLLVTYTSAGQTVVSSYQLLANELDSSLIQLLQDNRTYLKNTNQEMPLINKLEFRTETDELDLGRQEYVFRISFNGKKSREVQQKITQSQGRLYEL